MPIRSLLTVAAVAACAAALALAARAPASSRGQAQASSRSSSPPIDFVHFAGYCMQVKGGVCWGQASGTRSRLSITATIVVPQVKGCPFPNLGITPSAGTLVRPHGATAAALFVGCLKSKPRYFPVLDAHGTVKEYPKAAVRPGDTVVLTVSENSSRAVISVVDKTRPGTSERLTASGASLFAKPWIGDLSWPWPGDLEWGIPNFGTLSFSNCKLLGRPFAVYQPTRADNVSDVYGGGYLRIKTSRFESHGKSFKTIFKNP